MLQILMIRHGAVHADWAGRLYGALDVPLSSEGHAQARAVARELREEPLAAVVSSGLSRAEFTANLLRSDRPGLERIDRPRLAERNRGDWAGWTLAEIETRHPGAGELWEASHGRFTPPGGESLADVQARVTAEIDRLAEEHRGGQIAIVAHLWVVRAAVAAAIGLPADGVGAISMPTSGRARIQWRPGGAGARGRLIEMHGTPPVRAEDRVTESV
ncbi:MAG: histidine phosphatase family protein [Planctomycetota bacterium]